MFLRVVLLRACAILELVKTVYRMAALAGLLILTAVAYFFIQNSRVATESPQYQVLLKEGAFELREYPELLLITSPMDPMERGMNGSFGRLFRFITGENRTGQKIAMTTPVLLEGGSKGKGTMSFVVPKAVAEGGAPEPKAAELRLRKQEAGCFAVLRFKGSRSAGNEGEAVEKLKVWMAGKSWQWEGEAFFGYYDPPWTPVWFRRNEVLWRLENPHVQRDNDNN